MTGDGTKNNPYKISSARELKKIGENLSAHYALCGDIELNGEFTPIGSQFEPFEGVLDGRGYTVKNLKITETAQYAGLFARNAGTVKNLKVEADIEATAYAGGIAGRNGGEIRDCAVLGKIKATSFAGAHAGYNDKNGTVSGKSECEVIGAAAFAGSVGSDESAACENPTDGENEIYVSPEGDDKGDGSFEKPLLTLREAQKRVRKLIKEKTASNIAVVLRGGDYFIDTPLELTEQDCFEEKYSVIYRGFGEEKARLIGGKIISEWENYKKGTVRAFVGKDADFHTLFVNGELTFPAKSEKLFAPLRVRDKSRLYAVYSHGWFSEVLRVKKLSPIKSRVETHLKRSVYSQNMNYLMGDVSFIKNRGDWALGADGYLYYYPGENDPMEIVVPTVKRIFSLCGKEEKPVERVKIENLTLGVTDFADDFTAQGGRGKEGFDEAENLHAAVYGENIRDCAVLNCRIENCGLCGVTVKGKSEFNLIKGNVIENIGFTGVYLCGAWIDSLDYINKHNLVSDNRISAVGKFAVNGAGVYAVGSGHNHIYRNLIYDSPRYGVSLKGARYGCWQKECNFNLDGKITFENHWERLHTRYNVIEGNEIYGCGKNSADGGGVEAWGPGKGNVIDRNRISDFYNGKPTLNWKGHGIFLDDATHWFTVTNNIVYESGKQGADASTFMKSMETVVRNNIFDVTNTHQGAANISPYVEPCRNQTFVNNIVYADPKGGIGEDGRFFESDRKADLNRRVYTYDIKGAETDTDGFIKELDRNLYFNTCGELLVSKNNNDPSKDVTWVEFANETGFDKNSVSADPLFVNAPERDYTLKENSPAFSLGFKQIDTESIGLINKK